MLNLPLEPYCYQPNFNQPTRGDTATPLFHPEPQQRRPSIASLWSSPVSAQTCATTPDVSPLKYYGRNLLPRIRPCDQALSPGISAQPMSSFRRAASHDIEALLVEPLSSSGQRANFQRGSTCPPATASSSQQEFQFLTFDSLESYQQGPFLQPTYGHGRSVSAISLDPSLLQHHDFPYRDRDTLYPTCDFPLDPLADFFPDPDFPITIDDLDLEAVEPMMHQMRELTPEYIVETGNEATTCLLDYLTEPNAPIQLVPDEGRLPGDGMSKHYWWDIRQLRNWDDFTYGGIFSIPDFPDLLNIAINSTALPSSTVISQSTSPTSLHHFFDIFSQTYGTKLNASLQAAQGLSRHAHMRAINTARDGPHMLCNYVNNATTPSSVTVDSEIPSSRARVVGMIRTYEQWNTGMRNSGSPARQIQYLNSLAHLQTMMREQSCRYGFIQTEIELVCVRMGSLASNIAPHFGLLELSTPIPLSAHHSADDPDRPLTAALALWYLHMLTLDEPLPSQASWQISIGAPAERTRAKIMPCERDAWILKLREPQVPERRRALRLRGWVWPTDQYKAKLEGGTARKIGKARTALERRMMKV